VHSELRRSRAIRAAGVPRLGKTTSFQSRLLRTRRTTRGRDGRNEQNINSARPARRTAASKRHSRPQRTGRGAPGRNADHVRSADDGASTNDRSVEAVYEKSCMAGDERTDTPLNGTAAEVCAIGAPNASPFARFSQRRDCTSAHQIALTRNGAVHSADRTPAKKICRILLSDAVRLSRGIPMNRSSFKKGSSGNSGKRGKLGTPLTPLCVGARVLRNRWKRKVNGRPKRDGNGKT